MALRTELENKFYVIKPEGMDAPVLSYRNLGNLLLEQREQILSWIASHATNAEAVARYQIQLELLDETLNQLGLITQVADQNGDLRPQVKRELDALFLEMPNVYATPGSIFVEADNRTTPRPILTRNG